MFFSIFLNKSIKFVVPSILGIILFLKLSDRSRVWLNDLLLRPEIAAAQSYQENLERTKLVNELENFERNFFRHRDKPTNNCQKCDACRTIAYQLDKEFEKAEAKLGINPAYIYSDQGNSKIGFIRVQNVIYNNKTIFARGSRLLQ